VFEGGWKLPEELNVLALVKGSERYIFVYDDVSRPQLIDTIRDLAANPQMSLSWFDANVLTRKAREQEFAEPESEVWEQESGIRNRLDF
jgi:hypothetical protein